MISLFSFQLTTLQIIAIGFAALFMGMTKTGVQGVGLLAISLAAAVFGGQASTGFLLPIMIIADVFGVWYYHRHASWGYLRRMFPWTAIGVVAGVVAGNSVNDEIFRLIMAVTILASLGIMIWMERGRIEIPDTRGFVIIMGLLCGFTSMVGNLAGIVMALYLLAIRVPKNTFIGTAAWFFLMLNCFKVPFHIIFWKTITVNTFFLGLLTIPMILLGAWLGVVIIKTLKEGSFRWFVILVTLVVAAYMLM